MSSTGLTFFRCRNLAAAAANSHVPPPAMALGESDRRLYASRKEHELGLIIMEIRWVALATAVLSICLTGRVLAQTGSGYVGPIEKDASSLNGNLPPINVPQPGWGPVLDLKNSDGTVSVPRCDDPAVIATVRDGIIGSENSQFQSSGGTGDIVTKASLGPVWVHPSAAGGFVCDMHVQTDLPMTSTDDWKFQTFAQDGSAMVFFMDADGQ